MGATCERQLLGSQGVSLRVCGAADPSQGPWEPDALSAALSQVGQATAGGALYLPFPSLSHSSPCWSPWQCASHRPLSPPPDAWGLGAKARQERS